MVPVQSLLLGKPVWYIHLDLLMCHAADELELFAKPALSFLKTTEL